MKILFAMLLILLTSKSACSQTPYMDNLKKHLLLNSTPDTQRVLLFAKLAYATAFMKPDSGMLYAQKGVNLARNIGFMKGEVKCKHSMGATMWLAGEYSEANELLLGALKYAKSINDSSWQINIYRDLSANNRDQGNYQDGLMYSFKAIELGKLKKQPIDKLGLSYIEAGAIYQEMNIPDSALYYLHQVKLPDNPDNDGFIGFNFLMIGRTYAKMGNDALALKYYKLSIEALSKSNDIKDIVNVYNSIAKLYKKEDKTDSCIYYAKMGFDMAQNASFKKGLFETSVFLSEIYEKKDAAQSLSYYKIATAAKDSMFNLQKTMRFLNSQFNEQVRLREEEANKLSYRNKIRIYTLLAALGVFLLLAVILYRNNRHKQKAKAKVEKAYNELKATQAQLIQSEKMASLGELTAGIAHEIQNPLNFVNNFSEINSELLAEMSQEIDKGNFQQVKIIAEDVEANEDKIGHHGKRADAIVKAMLQHSRSTSGTKEPTDINALTDQYLRLSYHGLRASDKSFNVTMQTNFDESIEKINIIPQDVGRVLLNLFNNAFFAVTEKKRSLHLPKEELEYEPVVSVSTKLVNSPLEEGGKRVEIRVGDNGNGIPPKVLDKIFQPFFTTKPTGQGTGLGLSLSYDIIKAHGGEIKVETKENERAEFVIYLPLTK